MMDIYIVERKLKNTLTYILLKLEVMLNKSNVWLCLIMVDQHQTIFLFFCQGYNCKRWESNKNLYFNHPKTKLEETRGFIS